MENNGEIISMLTEWVLKNKYQNKKVTKETIVIVSKPL